MDTDTRTEAVAQRRAEIIAELYEGGTPVAEEEVVIHGDGTITATYTDHLDGTIIHQATGGILDVLDETAGMLCSEPPWIALSVVQSIAEQDVDEEAAA